MNSEFGGTGSIFQEMGSGDGSRFPSRKRTLKFICVKLQGAVDVT